MSPPSTRSTAIWSSAAVILVAPQSSPQRVRQHAGARGCIILTMAMDEKSATGNVAGRSYPASGKVIEEDQMVFTGGDSIANLGVFLIPIVGSIALFSFLAVTKWSDARRKEREAYYTTEALKKIAESSAEGAKSAVEYLKEQNRNAARRRLEGLRLGGLISAAVGIGMMAFL